MKKIISVAIAIFILCPYQCMAARNLLLVKNGHEGFNRERLFVDSNVDEAGQSQSAEKKEQQEKWKKELSTARIQRGVYLGTGIGAVVAGAVVYSNGLSKNKSAEDVPGCSLSGDTVFCKDSQSTAEAQRRIDDGISKMATGLIVFLVGSGLSTVGLFKHNKVADLQRRGKKRGYSVSFDVERSNPKIELVKFYKF